MDLDLNLKQDNVIYIIYHNNIVLFHESLHQTSQFNVLSRLHMHDTLIKHESP